MNRLSEYRKRIDDIDISLIDLLESRLELIKEIAKIKKENNITLEDSSRENEIIIKISSSISGEYRKYLTPQIISNIWNNILSSSKLLLNEIEN